KYPTSKYISMKVMSIDQLTNVRDKCINKITIIVDVDKLDSLVAGELIEKLNKCKMDPDQKDLNGNQMEGASVHLQCNSAQCMRPTNLTSSSFTLKISKELLDFLDSNDCFAYKVN
ncbi:MAG: hypothetical protein SOW57_03610, partial [Prevotella sp.]|nr:hypothetical protein [Prevotella sp.]